MRPLEIIGINSCYFPIVFQLEIIYRKDIILPPHLYGQLNQHAEGFRMLTANGSITSMVEVSVLLLLKFRESH